MLYEDWKENISMWREKMRHLELLSAYRFRILQENIDPAGKNVLDIGSGPQFMSDLLKQAGANVTTMDKFAPCQFPCDVNEDFTGLLEGHSFDLIIAGGMIRYVNDHSLFFTRCKNLLSPGGILLVDEFNPNPYSEALLQGFAFSGIMEPWPKEDFPSLETIEHALTTLAGFTVDALYSCWPMVYLKGKYPFSAWYTIIVHC